MLKLNRLSASATLLTVLSAPMAYAQTASQITPPSFAPVAPRAGASVVIPQGVGASAPAGAEAVDVQLGDLRIEGAALDAQTLAALKARLIGPVVKLSEIFAAARALETDYASRGHVLVRVTVPAQTLDVGATLRLAVVEGFIERIDVTGVPKGMRRRVAAALAPLRKAGAEITLAELERRLLLAGDVPGVTLRSALAPGELPGGTVLVVEGSHRAVTALLSAENGLSASLGDMSYGAGVTLNGALGAGETIYARASGLPTLGRETSVLDPTPRNRMLALGVIVPIGHDGLTLNIESTDARTAPRHDFGRPGFDTRFQRLSGRLRYPFALRRAFTLSGELSFDAQDERIRIIDPLVMPLSLDQLRIVRATADLSAALDGGGSLRLGVELSSGLDTMGARSAGDASPILPLSRQGSDADFQKLTVDVALDQPLAGHLSLALRGRAQTGFGQVMVNAEEIGIANPDGLSALPTGIVQGDTGFVGRTELRIPFELQTAGVFARISPYGFGAYGKVHLERPTALEQANTTAAAYGIGVRLNAARRGAGAGLSASIEYGRGKIDGMRGETDRVTFNILTQF